MKRAVIGVFAILALLPVWSAEAALVTGQLGDQDLVSGTFHPSGDLTSANAGDPAIFNSNCGSDGNSGSAANCSLTWSLSYSIPAGQTITGATLTLGIWDLDSAVAGDQVAAYTINGLDAGLTAALNTQANASGSSDGKLCPGLNGPMTVFCSVYNVFTVTVPDAVLPSLATGPATVAIALQNGHGVLGDTTFNGAIIDFSQLDITTAPSENNGTNVPEPATLALLVAGLGGIVVRRLVRKVSGA